jgi:undecaprenyl diphosphate synthase
MYNLHNFHPFNKEYLHIGLIPDGGRRWAAKNGTDLSRSYEFSRNLIKRFIPEFIESKVDELSIYLASAQNFKRSKEEKDAFLSQILEGLTADAHRLIENMNVQINIVGRKKQFEGIDFDKITQVQLNQNVKPKLLINLCIDYNPLEEIINAFSETDTPENFLEFLWVKRPVNLVIRTGNANLVSNFLPLQTAYARLYFSEKLFNDIEWADIESFMNEYRKADIKYGE